MLGAVELRFLFSPVLRDVESSIQNFRTCLSEEMKPARMLMFREIVFKNPLFLDRLQLSKCSHFRKCFEDTSLIVLKVIHVFKMFSELVSIMSSEDSPPCHFIFLTQFHCPQFSFLIGVIIFLCHSSSGGGWGSQKLVIRLVVFEISYKFNCLNYLILSSLLIVLLGFMT